MHTIPTARLNGSTRIRNTKCNHFVSNYGLFVVAQNRQPGEGIANQSGKDEDEDEDEIRSESRLNTA